jgi:hypothetical protein
MGSQIDAIMDAVEVMSVSGVTTVYRGATLKDNVEVADLPVRIISAVGVMSSRTTVQTLGGAGHVMQTEWTITDVAMIRAAGMGIGLKDVAPGLEAYMAAYHDSARTLQGSAWALIGLSVRAQVLEWPQASGRYYDVVTATLTIREIIQ